MANIIVPSRRLQQPQGLLSVNSNNYSTKDLKFSFIPGANVNLIGDIKATVSSAISGVGIGGRNLIGANSGYIAFPSHPILGYISEFTCLSVCSINTANYSANNYFCEGADWIDGISFGTYLESNTLLRANGVGQDSTISNNFLKSDLPQILSVTVKLNVTNGTKFCLNAKFSSTTITNKTPLSSYSLTPQIFRVSNNATVGLANSVGGNLFLSNVWTRILSDEEILDLHKNPWQIFTSNNSRSYFDLAVSADTTTAATPTCAPYIQIPSRRLQTGSRYILNKQSDLTKNLVFCAVPYKDTYLDLITNTFGTPTGTSSKVYKNSGKSSINQVYAVDSSGVSTNKVVWPVSSTLRGGSMIQSASILCLGGSTAQVDNFIYTMCGNTEYYSDGSGFGLAIDSFNAAGRGNILKMRAQSSRGNSSQYALGNPFDNKIHFFGYSASNNGQTGNWFFNRTAEPFSGALAHGTYNTTNRQAFINAVGDYSHPAFSHDTFVGLALFWDREISYEEYCRLFDNPWQLFEPDNRKSYFDFPTYPASTTFATPLALSAGELQQATSIPLTKLGSGTPDATKILRGDGVWAPAIPTAEPDAVLELNNLGGL
jgi:hypothetical protein